jgi:hypothetical protein
MKLSNIERVKQIVKNLFEDSQEDYFEHTMRVVEIGEKMADVGYMVKMGMREKNSINVWLFVRQVSKS